MIAEIIAVGTEVTIGSISNTNTQYLSKRLSELGVEVCYHTSVDDNFERLSNVVKYAIVRSDIIILTGGLGPTDDDITKEAVASALGVEIEPDFDMEEHLKYIFAYSNRPMTSNNLKQAKRPVGSEFIPNPNGTAPGIFIKLGSKKIVLMPGPPREMIPMFEEFVVDMLKGELFISIKSVNTIGVGESSLEDQLRKMDLNYPGFSVNTYASLGTVEIKVIGKSMDEEGLQRDSAAIIKKLTRSLGDFIYGFDNVSIEEVILSKLELSNLRLAVGESCTGGEISKRLTRIPGASKSYTLGVIAYSESAKNNELHVKDETIKNHGAVSEETALEMAKGLLSRDYIDIAVATTGYAGPTAGQGKPIGLVFICIMNRKTHILIERVFTGDRSAIQDKASSLALAELYKFLNNTLTSKQ